MNYTEDEIERGYSVCKECDKCVCLLEAGFDVNTHVCAICCRDVADADEFFKPAGGEMVMK